MLRYLLALCLLLTACGGPRVYHEDEDFDIDKRHRREFSTSVTRLCEATRHVLLGQGYLVARQDEASEIVLLGQKEFKEDDKQHATLQIQAICATTAKGTTLFVTATESHFDVAETRESRTFSLPFIAPISLGSASSATSQLKLTGETVDDKSFYNDFFKAVERELPKP